MACPNCDHTMHSISSLSQVYWCPRCGSIRDGKSEQPALVGRLAKFCNMLQDEDPEDRDLLNAMRRIGILECLAKVANK